MSGWLNNLLTNRRYNVNNSIWEVQNEYRTVPNSTNEQFLRLTHIWIYNENKLTHKEWHINFDQKIENLHPQNSMPNAFCYRHDFIHIVAASSSSCCLRCSALPGTSTAPTVLKNNSSKLSLRG